MCCGDRSLCRFPQRLSGGSTIQTSGSPWHFGEFVMFVWECGYDSCTLERRHQGIIGPSLCTFQILSVCFGQWRRFATKFQRSIFNPAWTVLELIQSYLNAEPRLFHRRSFVSLRHFDSRTWAPTSYGQICVHCVHLPMNLEVASMALYDLRRSILVPIANTAAWLAIRFVSRCTFSKGVETESVRWPWPWPGTHRDHGHVVRGLDVARERWAARSFAIEAFRDPGATGDAFTASKTFKGNAINKGWNRMECVIFLSEHVLEVSHFQTLRFFTWIFVNFCAPAGTRTEGLTTVHGHQQVHGVNQSTTHQSP